MIRLPHLTKADNAGVFAVWFGARMSGMPAVRVEVMYKAPGSLLLAIVAVLFGSPVRAQQVAAETPRTILAAQIRTQGFTCDKALGATRDRRRSQPDRAVWVLKCSNATYRVTRAPDMAAKVEPLP